MFQPISYTLQTLDLLRQAQDSNKFHTGSSFSLAPLARLGLLYQVLLAILYY